MAPETLAAFEELEKVENLRAGPPYESNDVSADSSGLLTASAAMTEGDAYPESLAPSAGRRRPWHRNRRAVIALIIGNLLAAGLLAYLVLLLTR
jgi:hypothetical protein